MTQPNSGLLLQIEEIESKARSLHPAERLALGESAYAESALAEDYVTAVQAYALAKIARILSGKLVQRSKWSSDETSFDDVDRSCTNGGGGDNLLKCLRQLIQFLGDGSEVIDPAGIPEGMTVEELTTALASEFLNSTDTAAAAMVKVAREFSSQLANGFPSAQAVIDRAAELLAPLSA